MIFAFLLLLSRHFFAPNPIKHQSRRCTYVYIKVIYYIRSFIFLCLLNIVGEREISTERVDPDRVKGSSRKSATRDDGRNSRKQAAAAVSRRSVDRSGRPTCTVCTGVRRSTGPVDRQEDPTYGQIRSTFPVDRPGRKPNPQ